VIEPIAARLRPLVPTKLVAPVKHHVGRAVREKRIGNLPVDRGLDVLTFFLADVQTGFGPFIAIYLAGAHWTAEQIGGVLAIGTLVSVAAQVPAGAAIDISPWKRGATLVALLSVMGSALLLALLPSYWPVAAAEVLHGVASCMLVPAVAAVTLTRVGRGGFSQRLGRNTSCMALGNAVGAVSMGLAGAYVAVSAPFWIAAAFTVPAVFALFALPPRHETEPKPEPKKVKDATVEGGRVLIDARLWAFVVCVVLFFVANAFQLSLAVTQLSKGATGSAGTNTVLAACLLVAQLTVAVIGPWMGRKADEWGRKKVLLLGFCAVPLHALLLGLFGHWIVAVVALELLDGMGGAMYGVLQPLVASDITKGTNRFNLVLGVLGLAAALGGSLGTWGGGWVATHIGFFAAFMAMAGVGVLAVLAVWLLLPDTKGHSHTERPRRGQPQAAAA
jgi:MFS family permease